MISKEKIIEIFFCLSIISVVWLFGSNYNMKGQQEMDHQQSWIIIAFTDINYLPVTKLWYDRLSKLGYKTQVIITVDEISYKNLTREGKYRCEKGAENVQRSGFKNIVRIKLLTIAKYLGKGQNVFVSDVDTYWNYYFDLNKLSKQFDVIHAYATVWPPSIRKLWGFTLCTCIAGYRANKRTVELFRKLIKRCGKECSDQEVTNETYASVYNIKWHNNSAVSLAYNLTIRAFTKDFVTRSEINCHSWISMG